MAASPCSPHPPFFSPSHLPLLLCLSLSGTHTQSTGFTVWAALYMLLWTWSYLSSHCSAEDAVPHCVMLSGGVRGLETSMDSAVLATDHRGSGSFCLLKCAIPLHALPSPLPLGLPPSRGSTFSNSPTQRGSHFQICTNVLISRAVALTCKASVIFHIRK